MAAVERGEDPFRSSQGTTGITARLCVCLWKLSPVFCGV